MPPPYPHASEGTARREMRQFAIDNLNTKVALESGAAFEQVGCADRHIPVLETERKVLPYSFRAVDDEPFTIRLRQHTHMVLSLAVARLK